MKYKISDDGKSVEVDDKGLPIVVDDENKEFGIDAIHLYSKIPALQEEAKNHRLKAKEYSDKLKTFEGIEDPKAALDAMNTVKTLKDVDLKNKEELDRIKRETEAAWMGKFEEAKNSYKADLEERDNKITALESDVFNAMVSSQFTKSPFFSGKEPTTNLVPEIAESYFGRNFKVEKDDKGRRTVVGYINGHPIYSKKRPGEYADFDESMGIILDAYPMKDRIMQASSGSGGPGGRAVYRGQSIDGRDNKSFIDNLENIAKGKIKVNM